MLTAKDREYLANKHRGGLNNSKGNSYENIFAIYKIASLLKDYQNTQETVISAQIEDAFVDDLFLSLPQDKYEFYQIKNVQSLTWQSGSSQSLQYDFNRQKELMDAKNASYELFLIYSDSNSNVSNVPHPISQCTRTIFFPYYTSLNRLLWEYNDFKSVISNIAANRDATVDELLGLATILMGVWDASDKTNLSLVQYIQKIKDLPLTGNTFIFVEELIINPKAIVIYNKIPNFTHWIVGNAFYWSYKNMKGSINKGSYLSFEMLVIANKPQNFTDLESLM